MVMHPVALKYLCVGDIRDWCDHQLWKLESHLGWRRPHDQSILGRTTRLAEGLLSLKEIQYLGKVQHGSLPDRRDHLIKQLIEHCERCLGLSLEHPGANLEDGRGRVRAIRTAIVSKHFAGVTAGENATETRRRFDDWSEAADVAQDLMSYPNCYLHPGEATDTRIVETIQRMQETFFGHADVNVPLRVIIECDEAIVVPPEKPPRGDVDPLMSQLEHRLTSMLARMSGEANSAQAAGLDLHPS